jgi:C-terminal processing protease CtpA/Prc
LEAIPPLIDGGSVTAPRYAIYGLNGDWEVEGHGIKPDVEVEEYPKDVAAGHDLQLGACGRDRDAAAERASRTDAANPALPELPPAR